MSKQKFRYEVGTQAMPHLTNVLESDSNDDEIISYALDTLCNLTSTEADGDGKPNLIMNYQSLKIEI